MKTDLFQSSDHGTVFQISLEISKFAALLSAALSQHNFLGLGIPQQEFHGSCTAEAWLGGF